MAPTFRAISLPSCVRSHWRRCVNSARKQAWSSVQTQSTIVTNAGRAFTATGYAPAPVHLYPLARAITPPGRVRRYDTWFFTASRTAVAEKQVAPDGELLDLDWFTVDDARKLDLPNITRLVLDDVSARLQNTSQAMDFIGLELPFYYADACGFQRTLISCTMPQHTP